MRSVRLIAATGGAHIAYPFETHYKDEGVIPSVEWVTVHGGCAATQNLRLLDSGRNVLLVQQDTDTGTAAQSLFLCGQSCLLRSNRHD